MAEGKLGLALSGGGFRASLFHIGVLARLADCDLLRHVEVVSTVSGGSIVGALYYLKLKQLLERKADAEIEAADYRRLVLELLDEFLTAVQKNPRMLTFADPLKNLKMGRPDYSRSDRAGELFDELFYRPVFGPERRKPVEMRELLIRPKGEGSDFHPERHNAHRAAKVPILLINATTLNTGRNWRFEAIRMGEPPPRGRVAKDLDRRMRLVRPERYDQITEVHQGIELGHAVAASAAVPGLFNPLALSNLYVGARVELVDGGVHDNQGVKGLLDRGCNQLVISDGSGQMEGERNPSTFVVGVLSRTNSIMMSRIREEQIMGADCRRDVEAVCLMHLRKGLGAEEIPYIGADGRPAEIPDPIRSGVAARSAKDAETDAHRHVATRYGVASEVQEALSRIRTDLDAFHDAESYSLMLDGYWLTARELQHTPAIWARRGRVHEGQWPFQQVAPLMRQPSARYLKLLTTGGSTVFKVFALYPVLAWACGALMLLAAGALIWWNWEYLSGPVSLATVVPTRLMVSLALFLVGTIAYPPVRSFLLQVRWIGRLVEALRQPVRWTVRLLSRVLPSVVGSFFIFLYLKLLNPLYLKAGRVDRLLADASGPGVPSAPPFAANRPPGSSAPPR